jgi:subtilisin family serine protease
LSSDIAIIDSGINPSHPHVRGVAGGLTFVFDGQGQPTMNAGFEDRIGHGTAIAGIFRKTLPDARLWAVKIFQSDLTASSKLFFAALQWAIEAEMKIIHLSLGTERKQDRRPLARLCQAAYRKGIIILAAARGYDDAVYPAVFQSVIGVYWNRTCESGAIIFHPDNPIQFGAWGYPRPLPGMDQKHNFRGSSFAVAHVSVKVAQILVSDRAAGLDDVMNKLRRDDQTVVKDIG